MNRKILLWGMLLLAALFLIGCNGQEPAAGEEPQEEGQNGNNGENGDTSENGETAGDDFPTQDITMVVPWAPGGANDVSARFMAEVAPQYMNGHDIIVDNREGGGAVIGQTHAAEADPDGYTLLTHTTSAVSNTFTSETTFTADSFAPLGLYSIDPEILVVPADSEFEDLEHFLEIAGEEEVVFTTPGHSTSHHMAAVLLEAENDLQFEYAHTEGAPQMIQQMLGGHVDASLMSYGEIQNQLEDETLRVLGIMSDDRVDHLPDVPTFQEVGIDMVYGPFRGIAAPADTPQEIITQLEDIFEQIITDPEYVEKMEQGGYEVVYMDPQEHAAQIQNSAEFTEKALPLLEESD